MNKKIQQAFNRAAKTYDEDCQLQLQTGKKLIDLIKNIQPDCHSIIDLGCGTGIVTQLLASQFHYNLFHAIDIASHFLVKANQRLSQSNIQIYKKNFDEMHETSHFFDLAFSNMSLHWSINFENCFKNIYQLLNTNGHFAFCIPTSGTFAELKSHFAIQHFHEINAIKLLLKQSGFHLLECKTESFNFYFPNTMSALRSIKKVGANYVPQRQHKGLHINKQIHSLQLQQLTYVISFFIVKKFQ